MYLFSLNIFASLFPRFDIAINFQKNLLVIFVIFLCMDYALKGVKKMVTYI